MDFLAFQLYAPLASWGDVAVGEHRPSHDYPGRSAVLGLLAAALGIRRDEDHRHAALSNALYVAVAVYSPGRLLRDYHTVQVPSASALKKRPHLTRADELAVPKDSLNTILSTRDYRQDAYSIVLVWMREAAKEIDLDALRLALERPRFVLYLGRKSCPPALPLMPHQVSADTLSEALVQTRFPRDSRPRGCDSLLRIAYEADAQVDHGLVDASVYSAPRRDQPISRVRWQFSDRQECVALAAPAARIREGGT